MEREERLKFLGSVIAQASDGFYLHSYGRGYVTHAVLTDMIFVAQKTGICPKVYDYRELHSRVRYSDELDSDLNELRKQRVISFGFSGPVFCPPVSRKELMGKDPRTEALLKLKRACPNECDLSFVASYLMALGREESYGATRRILAWPEHILDQAEVSIRKLEEMAA